jgi:hypothetical protein
MESQSAKGASGRNVFDMSDLLTSLQETKPKEHKETSPRSSHKKSTTTSKLARKSTRTRKSTKRFSPAKTIKKPRTAAQKAAVSKAKSTRELNKRLGFKTTAARRSAAAKKAQETRKRFNLSDMRKALDDMF